MDLFILLQEMIKENIYMKKIGEYIIILDGENTNYFHFHIFYYK